jgi:hypothetical protein
LRDLINLQDLTAPGESLFLPLVAVGKLYKGALKSNHPERNRLWQANRQDLYNL